MIVRAGCAGEAARQPGADLVQVAARGGLPARRAGRELRDVQALLRLPLLPAREDPQTVQLSRAPTINHILILRQKIRILKPLPLPFYTISLCFNY